MSTAGLLVLTLIASFLAGSAGRSSAASVSEQGLCRAGEEVIFACQIGRKAASLCGRVMPGGVRAAIYRFGRPGRIELALSDDADFSYASRGWSGGGETQVRVVNGTTEYRVFSRTVRTGFGPDGRNNPQDEAGVRIVRGGRTLAVRRCTGASYDATVRTGVAARYMPRDRFVP